MTDTARDDLNETREAMGMRALANIEAFAKGEAMPDPVA